MKKKKEKDLLVDKKECSKCGHVLESDIKVCNECGYDMTMEESLLIFAKKFKKIIREQTNPIDINFDRKSGKYTKSGPSVQINPNSLKPGVYQLNVTNDEGEEYTYNSKDKTLNKQTSVNMDALKSGDTIKVADEGKKKKYKYNPWAVCTASVGRKDKKNYEKCVLDVKKQQEMDEGLEKLKEYIERIITDSEINPKIKKGNFKQFLSKLK